MKLYRASFSEYDSYVEARDTDDALAIWRGAQPKDWNGPDPTITLISDKGVLRAESNAPGPDSYPFKPADPAPAPSTVPDPAAPKCPSSSGSKGCNSTGSQPACIRRMVDFYPDDERVTEKKGPWPAVITHVHSDTCVDLFVFDSSIPHNLPSPIVTASVKRTGETGQVACWDWPKF